jgi:hypothetical protein
VGGWTWYSGATGAVGVIALILALLLWTIGGISQTGNGLVKDLWKPSVLGLTITGVAGIMTTPVGDWARTAIDWVNDLLGFVGRFTGITVIVIAAVALAVIISFNVFGHFTGRPADLLDKLGINNGDGIDGRTLGCGGGLAVLAGSIPGEVGYIVSSVLGGIVRFFAWLIVAGFGL